MGEQQRRCPFCGWTVPDNHPTLARWAEHVAWCAVPDDDAAGAGTASLHAPGGP